MLDAVGGVMPIDRDDIEQEWIACLKGLHEVRERYENELDAKDVEIEQLKKNVAELNKGLYDRPVVVPEIIVQKGKFAVYRCPDCLQGAIGRGFNYCDNCGVKLNWSKADD
jgi:hypothetical protein